MPSSRRAPLVALLTFLTLLALPSLAHAAGVQPRFDLSSPEGGPFPSNRWTTFDWSQETGLRVNLPKPDCAVRPSDCADIDVLNALDGFNMQPRISIPFTGPIDPTSVNSSNVFLISLHDFGVTGINQIAWEVASNTLHVESDQLLRQHTTYILVVTTGVRDASGHRIGSAFFRPHMHGEMSDLVHGLPGRLRLPDVAVATIFTTQSATSLLEQVRHQIKASTPAAASFLLGTGGERTVFPLAGVTSVRFSMQTGTAPTFEEQPNLTPFLAGVGSIAFGAFDAPDYETASKVIPALGTRTGVPAVQRTNRLYFNLFLPPGAAPAGGWPVAIYGHGFTDNKNQTPFLVAGSMARRGIATIAINVVGHGSGPLGTLTVNRTAGGPVVLSAGGRGIDQDGNTVIDTTEGVNAAPPQTLIATRDALRQTVIDLMSLVREIEVGMDVDGNGTRDLDPSRISYFGQSFGGIYGTKFLAVEPDVHVGVPNVPGGSIIEVARLGAFRPLVWLSLVARTPPLANLPGLFQFNENMPLRNRPPLIDTVTGASAIQQLIEWSEWTSQSGNPVAYAVHLRAQPLSDVPAKSVILQFARGDKTVPNPTTSAIIRAGRLVDRTTLFRNDLAFAADTTFPKNPHTFLTRLPGTFSPPSAGASAVALAGQDQIAQFIASGGTLVVDPDGAGPLFETPMVGEPPEDLAYIP
jgi:Big-like domain-containing protein